MTNHEKPATQEQALKPFEMGQISPEAEAQARRGWSLEVNGDQETEPVTHASVTNERLGVTVEYGQRPEGFDGPMIRERGGGGAVTIPYLVDNEGKVFVGVVEEYRAGLGGKVNNVPRGFLDAGETHDEAAEREIKEETGYEVGSRIMKLTQGLNPNSTFFDTSRSEEEGVAIYAFRVEANELEQVVDEQGNSTYAFPATVREQAEGDKAAERIMGSRFVPVAEAAASRDMFTSAAVGQLMTAMFEGQVPYQAPQSEQ